uniref:Uncharacterized protein n=1 Tax=Ursus maritimus TaxID=29073 RepID=A0A452VGY1_URSMA
MCSVLSLLTTPNGTPYQKSCLLDAITSCLLVLLPCLAGVLEQGPHPPSATAPGCWFSWACCGAREPQPRTHSGLSPCSGAWHPLASPGSMPTTRSSAGP